eukprot:CAMPEP_0172381952 /NCGR_PEP_ID=MMETSP1060-20121228/71211_1 /TAXON_ID=37318 /ORGANISM="Pseudo-nitzschia pungens, Strain cf. cingulata" /LENGTH=426 /DNA_ID=CAMNT_0013109743 /DNA_START=604 /DNA_END=1884 /DNA_ORIENTATION=-
MSRDEERRFLANARVSRSSDAANPAASTGDGRWKARKQSPSLSPPPFGEGQQAQTRNNPASMHMHTDKDDRQVTNGSASSRTMETNQRMRSVRLLPVKVLGRVSCSSSSSSGDDNGVSSSELPRATSGLPEVAIVGRSNVGKSTLLNALLYSGRTTTGEEPSDDSIRRQHKRRGSKTVTSRTAKLPKGLKAKTSSKPGETRSIDFYQLSAEIEEVETCMGDERGNRNGVQSTSNNNGKRMKKKSSLILVDLPGYGFAFGSKKERNTVDGAPRNTNGETPPTGFFFPWQSLIETYITYRPRSSLKRVLLLIDARHGMKQADILFLESLQTALRKRQREVFGNSDEPQQRIPTELPPLQIVLTKCDLVSQVDLARRVVQVRRQLSDCLVRQPKMLPEMLVSAQIEGQGGVLEMQKELASLCDSAIGRE